MTHTFDRSSALDRVDGDLELFRELIDLFFLEFESSYDRLALAVQRGQERTIEHIAHSLKGALGNLGAMQASECAGAIERSAKIGDVEKAREEFEGFIGYVNAYAAAAIEFRR